MTKRTLFVTVALACFLSSAYAFGEVKSFTHTVKQPFGGSQSPDDARIAAIAKAKHEVLEMAGTYIESLTVVKDFVLEKDETVALAAGLLKAEIVSEKRYAGPDAFGLEVTTRVDIDTGVLEKRMKKVLEDRALLEKYNEIRQREKELLSRIQTLEAENRRLMQAPARAEDREKLKNEFREVAQALPASEWNRKAVALWRDGKYTDPRQALEYLDRSIGLDSENARAFNNRGVAYYNLGQRIAAIYDFSWAIHLDPDYADAYSNRGAVYKDMGQYRQAIENYDRVIRLNPKNVDAYLNRGTAWKHLWQYRNAIEDYNRALCLDAACALPAGSDASAIIELHQMDQLCEKAREACELGLCKSMDYLREKGFCR